MCGQPRGVAHNGGVDAETPTEPATPAVPQPQGQSSASPNPADEGLRVPSDWAERSDDDPAEVARIREERASRRLRQTVRDMLLSMLVVTGVVLLLFLPWNHSQPDPVRVVDPNPVVTGARATEPWPVLAPVGLPSTWRCTSARIDTAGDGQDVVHLGYLTPATTYVGLEQSATKELAFVSEQTSGGVSAGSETIAGQTWQKLESPDGTQRSYVRSSGGVTYVVTGRADWTDLRAFTASLVGG